MQLCASASVATPASLANIHFQDARLSRQEWPSVFSCNCSWVAGIPEEAAPQKSVGKAIDRIRELRKQNKLGDLRTKDLIHEGHKY